MGIGDLVHRLAVFLLVGMTGNELCVAAFVEPVLRSLPEGVQVQAVPRVAGALGKAMPFWYAASLLFTGADWWLHRGASPAAGAGLSAGLQIIVLAVTLGLLVPINNRLAAMHTAYDGWLADARRWDSLHRVRVVLLVLASVFLVFSARL